MSEKAKSGAILIIKHGALGDLILATGPMKAIRQRHPEAHIVLLTGKSFAGLMKDCPFIDEILIDTKPKPWKLACMRTLIKQLRKYPYSWVYDLQTSSRSTWYYYLFPCPKPNISSLHSRASHRHNTPERTCLHTIDRQKQQLQIAGIADVQAPDISWLKGKGADEILEVARGQQTESALSGAPLRAEEPRAGNNTKYALLVPGGSAHRPAKRWPGERYAELAIWLGKQGITPILLGAGAEDALLTSIQESVFGGQEKLLDTEFRPPNAILNLCNQTSYGDIADLARGAVVAMGNDTGPMHIIAAAGCPSLVLFNSNESNPDLCAPRGNNVGILNVTDLQALPLDSVLGELKRLHLLDLS